MSFDHTIKAGTTSKVIEFMMRDSATGQGKTGLNSSNTTCYYVREGVTGGSAVTLNTGIGGGYFSGAFYSVTNMDGMYQFSIPNAVLASGADAATLLFTSAGAIDKQIRICLLGVDLYDATDMGVTNLANAAPSLTQIVDGVWDELASGHTSVGSFGYYLDDQVSGATAPTASEVSNAVWTQNLATHSGTAGSTAEALSNAVAPTVQQIVDGVWDEQIVTGGHTTVGTFGNKMFVLPEEDEIADAVWDELLSGGHNITNSAAEYLRNATGATATEVADAVWTEILTDHSSTVGSAAEALEGISNGNALTTDAIADAVWDEAVASHTTAGSFGKFLKNLKEGTISAEGSATGTPTTTVVATDLTNAVDSFYHDKNIVFTSGSLAGQTRHISSYNGTTKEITVSDAFSSAPSSGDEFLILATHEFSVSEVVDAVWTEQVSDHNTVTGSTAEALSTGSAPTEAEMYTYFTTGVRADSFKADTNGLALSADITALNDISAADVYTYFTQLSREDAFKADVASLSADLAVVDTVVDSIKVKTDQLTFTVAGQLDANALTSVAPTEAEIYAHFTLGNNEDAFKADVSGVATAVGVAEAVWDLSVSGHVLAGSFGELVSLVPSAGDVADAVWDEPTIGHTLSGSFGEISFSSPSATDIYNHFTSGSNEDAFKADVSALATASSVNAVASQITNLNDPTEAEIYSHFTTAGRQDTFKADTSGLATTLDVTSNVPSEAEIYSYFTNTTRPDAFKANVSGLSTFDPAVDIVANVTTVATVTGDVNTNATSRTASQADISSLATAASIAALNDVSAADVYAEFTNLGNEDVFKADLSTLNDATPAEVYAHFTTASNADAFKADVSALALESSVTTVDAVVDAIKVKSDQLTFTTPNVLDVAVVSGGGDDAATIYTYFTAGSNEDAFKSDVSGLASQADVTAIKSKTDNLNFTVGGQVDANSLTTVAPSVTDIYSYFASPINAAAFHANVSGLSTFNPATDTVANVATVGSVTSAVETDAASRLASQASVSGLATSAEIAGLNDPSAAEIYSHFIQLGREDAFKADVSALASQASVDGLNDLSGSDVADSVWNALSASYTLSGSFGEFLDGNVSNAGGTGNGLYRVDVLVQDSSLAAVPNARISVDGTSYELTTKSDGIATFMLDSGIYTLRCAPPEGYNVPADNVVTIVSSDIANTFTVSDTATPPSSSDVPWIG